MRHCQGRFLGNDYSAPGAKRLLRVKSVRAEHYTGLWIRAVIFPPMNAAHDCEARSQWRAKTACLERTARMQENTCWQAKIAADRWPFERIDAVCWIGWSGAELM